MRKHVPTALAATALLFAMTGGAFAAGHYLITSANQIKPSVLKGLRGKTGPRGPHGQPGLAGKAGGFSTANITQVTGPAANMCASGLGNCDVASSDATCPSGSVVVGGGWTSASGGNPPVEATVADSSPLIPSTTQDWYVLMINKSSLSASFNAVATCATPSGAAADIARVGHLTTQKRAQATKDLDAVRAQLRR